MKVNPSIESKSDNRSRYSESKVKIISRVLEKGIIFIILSHGPA